MSIGPQWVLTTMLKMHERGVDLWDLDEVIADCNRRYDKDMVEWIRSHRETYNLAVINRQYLLIDFYHGT